MTKLLALGVAIGISFFCVAATSAMPLAPLEQVQASLTIRSPVAVDPAFTAAPMAAAVATATTAACTMAADTTAGLQQCQV
jgi:hypothetical protein